MIEIYFKTPEESVFTRIDDYREGCWIHVPQANVDDLREICEKIQLDMDDIRDCLDKHELPRFEPIDDKLIFFLRHPGEPEPGLYTETLTLLLTSRFVITLSPYRSGLIEQILQAPGKIDTRQQTKLILHILLKVTQDFTNRIKRVRYNTLEGNVPVEKIDSDAILILTKNEEILNQYLTSLVPIRNLLEVVTGERFINLYEPDIDLLEDLMIAIHQSEDVCRVNIKSIRSLRDSYHIIFTNDVNKTIKLLTALTIIFGIPTIIASVYGMNVQLPLAKDPNSFWIVLGLIAFTSISIFLVFLKKRWL